MARFISPQLLSMRIISLKSQGDLILTIRQVLAKRGKLKNYFYHEHTLLPNNVGLK